ncbi:CDP-glycerol glycerophosphotransferase family protein [Billgrantia sp. Q4P2]|uniref:CDP-glycerol glycerophosphotransferase family protein n=1 Tax=Billgrantia sp. Q4P2 TaxID=3463857 RepID=UPI0040569F2E
MRTLIRRGLTTALFIPLVILSFVVRKNGSIWVFGAWNGMQYSDNPRYLFESLSTNGSGICPIWISKSREVVEKVRSKGYRAYFWLSLKGVLYSLRAGVAVVSHSADDVNPFASYRAKIFKITHGTPMKRMGRDNVFLYPERSSRRLYEFFRSISPQRKTPVIAFVSSEISKFRFESAYRGSSIAVVNSGYPRWLGIIESQGVLWRFIQESKGVHRGGEFEKIIMYAPTRRANKSFKLELGQDFVDFVIKANEKRYFVVLRPHPSLQIDISDKASRELLSRGFLEATCQQVEDINSALQDVDVLLTDYSSIIYDFCILGRPSFLYAPDLDDYLISDTGLYENYGEAEPALKIDSLCEVLNPKLMKLASVKAELFRELHCGADATKACATIVKTIKEKI